MFNFNRFSYIDFSSADSEYFVCPLFLDIQMKIAKSHPLFKNEKNGIFVAHKN